MYFFLFLYREKAIIVILRIIIIVSFSFMDTRFIQIWSTSIVKRIDTLLPFVNLLTTTMNALWCMH